MSKLKLTKKPLRVVEIVLPDGEEIVFTLSNTKVKDLPDHEKKMADLTRDYALKDIDIIEYSFKVLDQVLTSDWREHEQKILELDSEDLEAIQVVIKEAREAETPAQKKSA